MHRLRLVVFEQSIRNIPTSDSRSCGCKDESEMYYFGEVRSTQRDKTTPSSSIVANAVFVHLVMCEDSNDVCDALYRITGYYPFLVIPSGFVALPWGVIRKLLHLPMDMQLF